MPKPAVLYRLEAVQCGYVFEGQLDGLEGRLDVARMEPVGPDGAEDLLDGSLDLPCQNSPRVPYLAQIALPDALEPDGEGGMSGG